MTTVRETRCRALLEDGNQCESLPRKSGYCTLHGGGRCSIEGCSRAARAHDVCHRHRPGKHAVSVAEVVPGVSAGPARVPGEHAVEEPGATTIGQARCLICRNDGAEYIAATCQCDAQMCANCVWKARRRAKAQLPGVENGLLWCRSCGLYGRYEKKSQVRAEYVYTGKCRGEKARAQQRRTSLVGVSPQDLLCAGTMYLKQRKMDAFAQARRLCYFQRLLANHADAPRDTNASVDIKDGWVLAVAQGDMEDWEVMQQALCLSVACSRAPHWAKDVARRPPAASTKQPAVQSELRDLLAAYGADAALSAMHKRLEGSCGEAGIFDDACCFVAANSGGLVTPENAAGALKLWNKLLATDAVEEWMLMRAVYSLVLGREERDRSYPDWTKPPSGRITLKRVAAQERKTSDRLRLEDAVQNYSSAILRIVRHEGYLRALGRPGPDDCSNDTVEAGAGPECEHERVASSWGDDSDFDAELFADAEVVMADDQEAAEERHYLWVVGEHQAACREKRDIEAVLRCLLVERPALARNLTLRALGALGPQTKSRIPYDLLPPRDDTCWTRARCLRGAGRPQRRPDRVAESVDGDDLLDELEKDLLDELEKDLLDESEKDLSAPGCSCAAQPEATLASVDGSAGGVCDAEAADEDERMALQGQVRELQVELKELLAVLAPQKRRRIELDCAALGGGSSDVAEIEAVPLSEHASPLPVGQSLGIQPGAPVADVDAEVARLSRIAACLTDEQLDIVLGKLAAEGIHASADEEYGGNIDLQALSARQLAVLWRELDLALVEALMATSICWPGCVGTSVGNPGASDAPPAKGAPHSGHEAESPVCQPFGFRGGTCAKMADSPGKADEPGEPPAKRFRMPEEGSPVTGCPEVLVDDAAGGRCAGDGLAADVDKNLLAVIDLCWGS